MKRAALFLLCLSFAVVASRAQTTPNKKLPGNRCNDSMFAPNYAAEVGVFKSVRWESFPLTVWIDPSTVRDAEEMADLQAGLSAWSTATHGVLGVTFVQKEQGAQISVRMVDTLD